MEEKPDASRCKQCDHLLSFHGEDGCGTWLLGVRAVPLYRCACVVSVNTAGSKFPPISTTTFQFPAPRRSKSGPTNAPLSNATNSSTAANSNLRSRLVEVAAELRRTAAELKALEETLDITVKRLAPTNPPHAAADSESGTDRRTRADRRRRHYAMIAERRVSERRVDPASV